MAYVDPQTVHNPSVGGVIPAAWGDAVRDAIDYLANPPVGLFEGAATTCAHNTWTDLAFSTEIADASGIHTGTAKYVTIADAGIYQCTTLVEFVSNATGLRSIEFEVNNTTSYTAGSFEAASSSTTNIPGTRHLVLAAGDTVKVRGRQTSGGSLDATVREFCIRFVSLG